MVSNLQIYNYVADAAKSAKLYAQILEAEPIDFSPTFAMFALPNGSILGLWSRHDVEPKATLPGGTEIGFEAASEDAVRLTRDAWEKLGLKIIQEPVKMDFGFTFTAADPDGHRLRVYAAA